MKLSVAKEIYRLEKMDIYLRTKYEKYFDNNMRIPMVLHNFLTDIHYELTGYGCFDCFGYYNIKKQQGKLLKAIDNKYLPEWQAE